MLHKLENPDTENFSSCHAMHHGCGPAAKYFPLASVRRPRHIAALMADKIGFVGVGRMGANMARRLADCGFPIVALFDANTATAQALAQEMACTAVGRLEEVSALADVVITVVSDDRAMKQIFSGGLLANARGRLFINCATVTPEIHVWVEKQCEARGAQSLEACMASSITQARQGTLYLMCGGKPEAFDRARPILEKLGPSPRYVGPAGKAAQVKALVNMVMNANTAALAEGLGLGDALGLDLTMLREVFAQTGARSGVLQTDGEDMQNRDHACFFSAAHAAKDSGIALKLAKSQHLSLPLAVATKKQYDRMIKIGLGDLDKSGIAELTFKGRKGGLPAV
jgi:3-hydroxyisobutyrate dehydrogenase